MRRGGIAPGAPDEVTISTMSADRAMPGRSSVLFSSIPLSSSLAATLHEAALDLYRRDDSVGQVAGDLVNGRIVNLQADTLQLGAIAGPAFEAKLDFERGAGTVRYLLTRQGLRATSAYNTEPPRGGYLNYRARSSSSGHRAWLRDAEHRHDARTLGHRRTRPDSLALRR